MALTDQQINYKISFLKYVNIMDPPIFILLSFFFMLSIYQQNFKFLVYIACVIALLLLAYAIGFITNADAVNASEICKMPSFFPFTSISYRSAIMVFSFIYCMLPMFYTGNLNYMALGLLAIFTIVIIGTEIYSRFNMAPIPGTLLYCTSIGGTIKGIILGLAMGFASFAIMQSTESVSLMYFGETEEEQKCTTRQSKYKCTIMSRL